MLVVKAIRRNFAVLNECRVRKGALDPCLVPRVELRVKIRQVVKAKYLPICDFEEYPGARISPAGAQPAQFPKGCPLIENDKLDFRKYLRHQPGFEFADDPGKTGLRPRRLEGSKRRQGMTDIADCRKTQQTHVLQRRFEA